jgi:LemA protein
MPLIIFLAPLFFLVSYLIYLYNSLIVANNRIKEALSSIEIQLKRRFDLVPNLVETVKGYAKHEASVFQQVTLARTALHDAKSIHDKAVANDTLTFALKSLFAVSEAYPDLKSDSNFSELQRQLEDTEDKVAYARQFYNSQVLDFNTKISLFPANFFSKFMNFHFFEFFNSNNESKEPIKVSF